MRSLLSLLLVFIVSISTVSAQSDTSTFNVRVFGGTDVMAPSTPTLSGSATAYDQIDVSWTASTDNFVVSGYVLSRDGVPISTTTQTSFVDASVVASTTYVYTVRAFDTAFNYSSSSNLVSITTPAEPVIPVDLEGNSQSTAVRAVLNELIITPGISTSSFYIRTARPARFEMRWGKTEAYELGYVINDRFTDTYRTTITDLEPGTYYYYEVVAKTPLGNATILERGRFKTLDRQEFLPPSNVSRFTATGIDNNVALRWQNPLREYANIRIVRSHLGFPMHLQDGAVIYQGRGTDFIDKDILSQFSPVYYTAFVVDSLGNVSSGAIARAYAVDAGSVPHTIPIPIDGGTAIGDPQANDPAVIILSPELPRETKMPDISEIYLFQAGKQYSFADANLNMDATKEFVLSIPKEAVFESIKTIIVSLTDPTDSRKSYSFLLRINKDHTAYEGIIAPLTVAGVSQIIINIYDFKGGVVGTYKKNITFSLAEDIEVIPIFPDRIIQYAVPIIMVLSGLLLIIIFTRMLWRYIHNRTS